MATMRDLRFGVEIETVGLSKPRLAQAIHSVVGGEITGTHTPCVIDPHGRQWCVKHDGSLSGYENGEVTTPPLTYSDLPTLQRVVRAIRVAGATVNSSCGLHIHVDASLFDGTALANLTKMVYANESYIMQALAVSDRRRNSYCKPCNDSVVNAVKTIKPTTKERFQQVWRGNDPALTPAMRNGHHGGDRYHGLNMTSLGSHGTIEFRYFNGTVHAGKIKAYIQLVLSLSAYALTCRRVKGDKRVYNAQSAKYDFRVVLLRLGMIGPEFRTAREFLLRLLPGSAERKTR